MKASTRVKVSDLPAEKKRKHLESSLGFECNLVCILVFRNVDTGFRALGLGPKPTPVLNPKPLTPHAEP